VKTFNNKPQRKNILAVILGIIGIMLLSVTWTYHMLVQYVTMPKINWLNPLDETHWQINPDYPNSFCFFFCNIEATMIHHLYLLRVGFGTEYCKEIEKGRG